MRKFITVLVTLLILILGGFVSVAFGLGDEASTVVGMLMGAIAALVAILIWTGP